MPYQVPAVKINVISKFWVANAMVMKFALPYQYYIIPLFSYTQKQSLYLDNYHYDSTM